MAMKIDTVAPGSDAAALGLGPGDELLSVDGNPLNDALDYQFYTDSPGFHLTARIGGQMREWGCGNRYTYSLCAIWGLTRAPFGAILTRQLFRGVLCNLT